MSKDYEQAVCSRGNSKTATTLEEMSQIIANSRKIKHQRVINLHLLGWQNLDRLTGRDLPPHSVHGSVVWTGATILESI